MTNATLGTWTNGTNLLNARFFDKGSVQLSNNLGQSWVVSDDEWLTRWDGLRDAGWRRKA